MCVLYMYQYIKLSGHFWAGCPLGVFSQCLRGFGIKKRAWTPLCFLKSAYFFPFRLLHI